MPSESSPLTGSSNDILIDAGVELPAHLGTPLRRWLCVLLYTVAGACATGPMTMFMTLEPIFIKEGVFEGPDQQRTLTALYSIIIAAVIFGMLPFGMLFDYFGPKWVAVVGSLGFAIFSVGTSIALRYRELNWLLFVCYPLAVVCGYGKNRAACGYHWLLSDHQNTINSLVVATQAGSQSLVLVGVWLHNTYGWQIWTYFEMLAALSVCVALIGWLIVPNRDSHLEYAAVVVSYRKENKSYGSGDDDTELALKDKDSIQTSGSRNWDNIKGVFTVMSVHPAANVLFICLVCTFYMCVYYQIMQMYPYYTLLLGSAVATHLVDIYAVVYGFSGFLAVVCYGRIMDWIGLQWAIALTAVLIGMELVGALIANVAAQIYAQIIDALVLNAFIVFGFRFAMLYAPPELFGTYTGFVFAFLGLFQLVMMGLLSSINSVVSHAHELLLLQTVYVSFAVASCALTVAIMINWHFSPCPAAGSLTRRQAGLPEEKVYEDLGM